MRFQALFSAVCLSLALVDGAEARFAHHRRAELLSLPNFRTPLSAARKFAAEQHKTFWNLRRDVVSDTLAAVPVLGEVPALGARNDDPSADSCTDCSSTLSFAGDAAKAFEVTNDIPTVGFKTKTSWAGLLPIGNQTARELYFWLWGKDDSPSDDLVIWLNGGPGCSSLGGFLLENGPISYLNTKDRPRKGANTWTQEANVIWVEQPVGTGFSQGTPEAKDDSDVARDFVDWWDNVLLTFPELATKRLFVTGESYAGFYVSYIMAEFYKRGTYNLKGGLLIDATITEFTACSDLVADAFIDDAQMKQVLGLTDYQRNQVFQDSKHCGFRHYLRDNLAFPPNGPLPPYNRDCDRFPASTMQSAAARQNPAFDIYRADGNRTYSSEFEPTGDANTGAQHGTWFSNPDLQAAIHAPNQTWEFCTTQQVFPNGDASAPAVESVLPGVIEASSSGFIVAGGGQDALVITNGTLLGIQNMTWGGAQGLSTPPTTPLIGKDGQVAGSFTTDRNLTFAEIPYSGHMIPADAPQAGLALLRALLGVQPLSG